MTMLHYIRQNQFWDTLEALSWEVLSHAAYSPDLAPSDYHLFASMSHALAQQRFGSYEDVKKWLDEWFAAKGEDFYWREIHKIARKEKYVTSNGAYFEQISFYRSSEFNMFFFGKKIVIHTYTPGIYIYRIAISKKNSNLPFYCKIMQKYHTKKLHC